MAFLAAQHYPTLRSLVIAALAGSTALLFPATSATQGQTATFTMYTPSGRRNVAVRTAVSPEMLALDQLASTFGLTFTEDRSTNGLVIGTRGDRIFAFPGQSFVRAAGRVIALAGPVQRERSAWYAPLDFLTKALGPSVRQPITIRRASRLILVGDVNVPEISGRVERTANGARVVISIQPSAPHRVTRDGNRLTIRFDATALDASAFNGFLAEFATAARVDGTNILIDLGPSAATYRAEDDASGRLTIDLMPPAPVAPPPPPPPPPVAAAPRPRPGAPAAPPQFEAPSGAIRTVVLDAGHGGTDEGAVGANGLAEETITLQMARRLKASMEARLGVRVLLTRDSDTDVSLDRRTELANNNKADVFISLHANHSVRLTTRGAQIYTVGLDSYRGSTAPSEGVRRTVPVVGGGSRAIDPVPWDLAQAPFATRSAALGAALARQFTQRGVPLNDRPLLRAPMRVLMAANMPAVLIELGFLSSTDDEQALSANDWQSSVVESIISAILEWRRSPAPAPALDGGRR